MTQNSTNNLTHDISGTLSKDISITIIKVDDHEFDIDTDGLPDCIDLGLVEDGDYKHPVEMTFYSEDMPQQARLSIEECLDFAQVLMKVANALLPITETSMYKQQPPVEIKKVTKVDQAKIIMFDELI